LVYIGVNDNSLDAFTGFFCKRVSKKWRLKDVLRTLPNSLVRYLNNFHALTEIQRFPSNSPLVLERVVINNLPIMQNAPLVDIWDSGGIVWPPNKREKKAVGSGSASGANDENGGDSINNMQWNEEEGCLSLKLDVVCNGDFMLVCSLPDANSDSTKDETSQILFRYTNTTGFLAPGPLTLSMKELDMYRGYVDCFDANAFSMILTFSAQVGVVSQETGMVFKSPQSSFRDGISELTSKHCAPLLPNAVQEVARLGHNESVTIAALTLAGNDVARAKEMLSAPTKQFQELIDSGLGTPQKAPQAAGPLQPSSAPSTPSAVPGAPAAAADSPAAAGAGAGAGAAAAVNAAAIPPAPPAAGAVNTAAMPPAPPAATPEKYPKLGKVASPAITDRKASAPAVLNPNMVAAAAAAEGGDEGNEMDKMMAFVAQVKNSGMSMDDFMSKLKSGDTEGLSSLAALAGENDASGVVTAPADGSKDASSSSSSTDAPRTAEQVLTENRRLLVDFYQEHDPEKVGTVDKILGAWKTKKLTNALMKKYGQAPPFVGCSISMGLAAEGAASPVKKVGADGNPLSPTLSTPGASPAQPAQGVVSSAGTKVESGEAVVEASAAGVDTSPTAAAAAAAAAGGAAGAAGAGEAGGEAGVAMPSPRGRSESLPPSKLGGLFGGGGSPKKAASPAAKAASPAGGEAGATGAEGAATESEKAPAAKEDEKQEVVEKKEPAPMLSIAAMLNARNRALSIVTEGNEDEDEEGEEKTDEEAAKAKKEAEDATIGADAAAKEKKKKEEEEEEEKKKSDGAPKPAVKDMPDFAPYFKMLKMGLPKGAVKHKMQKDGKDPEVLNLDPNQPLPTPKKPEKKEKKPKNTVPVKDLPGYAPYFKMLKMGLPKGAVKHKMQKDDKDPAVLDMDPNKPLPDEEEEEEEAEEEDEPVSTVPIKDMPEVQKYLKMLKMGLPKGAVKQKMIKDGGVNPELLDMDPNKPPEAKKKKKKSVKGMLKKAAKTIKEKLVRRKKLHWSTVDDDEIDENSVWGQINEGDGSMGELADFDLGIDELNSLFTATNSPPKARKPKAATSSKTGGRVSLLEGKRTMNMEIALKSFKQVDKVTGKSEVMPYSTIREIIETLDGTKLTLDQVQGLEECMPSAEDKIKLGRFNGDKTKLGEAEKVRWLSRRTLACNARFAVHRFAIHPRNPL
jgi:hypothetical protein